MKKFKEMSEYTKAQLFYLGVVLMTFLPGLFAVWVVMP